MSEKIYWVAIDFDHVPTGEEMQNISESIGSGLDHPAIVTTKEVEPLDTDDVQEWINQLQQAVNDD